MENVEPNEEVLNADVEVGFVGAGELAPNGVAKGFFGGLELTGVLPRPRPPKLSEGVPKELGAGVDT